MLILLLRIVFVVFAVLIGMTSGQAIYHAASDGALPPWFGGAMGFGIAITLIAAEQAFRRRFTRSLVAFLIGLGGGLALSWLMLSVLRLVLQDGQLYRNLDLPLALVITYLVIITVVRGADRFRLVLPFVEFRHERTDRGALVLDGAALGDGRLAALIQAGVLDQRLLVHRRVLAACEESIASPDAAVQARGRRSIDGLAQLRTLARAGVTIDDTEIPNAPTIAEVLIGLARLEGARLAAGDRELARRALAEGVAVVDLSALVSAAAAIRVGDSVALTVEKPGEGKGQGVGYLDDGSMVVITDAQHLVGQRVRCTVMRLHQTAQGRMVFAEPVREGAQGSGFRGQGSG